MFVRKTYRKCLWLAAFGFAIHIHAQPQSDQEGQAAQPAPAIKTGVFTAAFTERSPHSNPDLMSKVTKWPRKSMPAYKVADHTFQLIVPEDYDGKEAFGLLVFIHPNNRISLDRFYGRVIQKLLAKHKLIWVSYNNAGNPVMPNIRMGLALDAVHNARQRYKIDRRRVYLSGLSGGGRMTCLGGIYYPQVFTGAIPIVGSMYFREMKLPDDPELRKLIQSEEHKQKGVWPQRLFKPKTSVLKKMKQEQRWVMLAGETDYNMPEMRAHYEQGFKKDGFAHAHYLEVPKMGHAYPPAAWFGKAIELLDKPLKGAEAAVEDGPPADARTQRFAKRRLDAALAVLKRDRERGIQLLERLVEELPNTEAAASARAKLKALAQEDAAEAE